MAITYRLQNGASDLTIGGAFTHVLAASASGTDAITAASGGGLESGYFAAAENDPSTNGTSTGTFTAVLNVSTASGSTQARCYLLRVNSSGVTQAEVVSPTGFVSTATTGDKTWSWTNPALGTWASGDRVVLRVEVQNNNAHGGAAGPTFDYAATNTRLDTPFAQPDLSRDVTGEALKIADQLSVSMNLVATPQEALRLADQLTVGMVLDVVIGTDALKLADAVAAALEGGADLSADVSETLLLDDIGQGVVEIVDHDGLKLADGPVIAEMTGDRDVALTQEVLRLADAVSATLDAEEASVQELLRLADTVTAARDLTAELAEALAVADTIAAQLDTLLVSADETLRLNDGDFTAARIEAGALSTTLTEPLRLADTVTAVEDPLQTTLDEALRVADTVTAATQLAATAGPEALRLDDAVTTLLDPEQASVADTVLIADALQVSRVDEGTLEANPAELLRLADVVAVTEDPLYASADEALRLTDALAAAVDLVANLSDDLRIADVVTADITLVAELTEVLAVQDALAASRDLTVDVAEVVHVVDLDVDGFTVAAGEVFVAELLRLTDAVQAEVDTLMAVVAPDALAIADALAVVKPPRVITSMAFGDESMFAATFSGEALSGNTFGSETLSEPCFSDEQLLP